MKTPLLLCSLGIVVMLASCQKSGSEENNTSTALQGTFKLKYMTSSTNSTVTSTDGEKTITTSDYTTTNNQGTILFNNSILTAAGLTYTVDTEAKGYLYDGADLIDSLSFPFSFTLPVSSASAPYLLIGADSIYFPQGSVTAGVDGTGSTQSGPSGGRYNWSGNTLTLIQHYAKDSSFTDSGETIHISESALSSMILEKQ